MYDIPLVEKYRPSTLENIVLDGNGTAKLCDFGVSRVVSSVVPVRRASKLRLTPAWAAPTARAGAGKLLLSGRMRARAAQPTALPRMTAAERDKLRLITGHGRSYGSIKVEEVGQTRAHAAAPHQRLARDQDALVREGDGDDDRALLDDGRGSHRAGYPERRPHRRPRRRPR